MNLRDKQYHDFFTSMGYEFIYYPDKNGFKISGIGYAKICENPASDLIVNQAKEASKKQSVILLEGNLTYRHYRYFQGGEEVTDIVFIPKGFKYYPLFCGEWEFDYFGETAFEIAMATKSNKIVCQKCDTVDDFKVSKAGPNITARCKHCGYWITNLPANQPAVLNFGKYAGREVKSLTTDEEIKYLQWLVQTPNVKGRLKEAILNQIAL
jgi:hypothetical protein